MTNSWGHLKSFSFLAQTKDCRDQSRHLGLIPRFHSNATDSSRNALIKSSISTEIQKTVQRPWRGRGLAWTKRLFGELAWQLHC